MCYMPLTAWVHRFRIIWAYSWLLFYIVIKHKKETGVISFNIKRSTFLHRRNTQVIQVVYMLKHTFIGKNGIGFVPLAFSTQISDV